MAAIPRIKIARAAVEWAAIDNDGRIKIPSEITDCLSWFTPKKKMPVLIDLSNQGMIVIRHLPEVLAMLEERRQTLAEDTEDAALAMRQVAMTHHFFREANLVVPERRIGLRAIVLDHLETKPGGRLFCLGYADRIEARNEISARELIRQHAGDLVIGS